MLSKPFKNQSNFALVNIRTNLKVKIYVMCLGKQIIDILSRRSFEKEGWTGSMMLNLFSIFSG